MRRRFFFKQANSISPQQHTPGKTSSIRNLALLVLTLLFSSTYIQTASACPDIDGMVDLNCDEQLLIVCFGDSITKGVRDEDGLGYPGRLALTLPNATIVNLGNPGEATPDGKARFSALFGSFSNADYFVILEGVNDFFLSNPNAVTTKNNLRQIVSNAGTLGASTLLGNLTQVRRPDQISWVSDVNTQLNPYKQINFFALGRDIISFDRLHPDGPGYQVMAGTVRSSIAIAGALRRPVDTDNDGVYDFKELQVGSNINLADSDGDTLSDAEELFIYRSNPISLDSDGDSLSDEREVREIGSDPANPRPGAPLVTGQSLL